MKKILITGSAGYIGTVLTDYLAERGYEVIGYDVGFFKDSSLFQATHKNTTYRDVRFISADDFKGIDAVVHLAGISNDPVGTLDPKLVYDPTRAYSLALANICKKLGIKFIFASSCSIYGKGGEELLVETSECYPQTFYSLNKQQIENDLDSISDKNFSPIALRFATIFGMSPRIRFDVVINMLVGMATTSGSIVLNSNGLSWRPNLHIQDACFAIMCAIELDHKEQGLLKLNVGSEEGNLQILEIAKLTQAIVPNCNLKFLSEDPALDKSGLIGDRKVKAGGKDSRTYRISFAKIKEVMPFFHCNWSVEDGIKEMYSLFKDLPLTQEIFESRKFYRLQQLEYLYSKGLINDELILTNDIGHLRN